MPEGAGQGVLSGVRVLDLADETAVLGTKLLADLGADVLRVEPPEGDPIRRLGPFADPKNGEANAAPGVSLSHLWLNTSKRSIRLDPEIGSDRERLTRIATEADIVIETGAGGLDVAALRAARPAVTVVSVSPFGASGPRSAWRAPDLIIWAMGGGMTLTGLPGREPLHANWSIANQVAGLYAAIGGLAGLYQARSTGRGAHFDLSRQEAMISLQETLVSLYVYQNQVQTRQGVENPVVAPYGAFPTADGKSVLMAVVTQGQWSTLTAWMAETGEVEPWILDEALLPMGRRAVERSRLHEYVGRWTRQFPAADLVAEANRRRIPCAPINTPLDILEDEQIRARGFFQPIPIPALGREVLFPTFAYQFDGAGPVRPAPERGEEVVGWREQEGGSSAASSLQPTPFSRSPLDGLRVLDLTWALAGPTGSRVLGDLGAEVVKIEPRDVGDIVRGLPPHWQAQPDLNRSGFFQRLGRNKRNLTLDLKKPEAIAVVKRLVAWADVVMDNFGAGVMQRLGLGPEELLAIKPDLVQVSLSGYGQEGPTRNYPSFAQISQARGGLVYSTGYEDGTPSGIGISLGDTGAGLQLAIVILAAIDRARRTGRGAQIDMSQLEAAIMLLGPALLEASINGRSFKPQGSLLPDRDAAPHGAYPAEGEDRWIAIAVLDDDQWRRLAEAMGRSELAAEARFATSTDRIANVAELNQIVGSWTAGQEAHSLAERLQAAGVPAGVVQNAIDLLDRDPHLAARGFFMEVDQPEMATVLMDTMPLRWTDGPVPIRIPGPLIGEYNEAVLKDVLGLSDEDVVELIINEVI